MSHTPHELLADLPEHADTIAKLKSENAHFARLYDEYHEINRQVHRSEAQIEPTTELAEVEMRKKRAGLKDQLWHMISAA